MKRIILVLLLILSASGLFAESPKGQILEFNQKANEEIIILNNTSKRESFKIYIHTGDNTAVHMGAFSVSVTTSEEGWSFLVKTPEIKSKEKWKSSQDYEHLENADYICIDTKSGNKYNYDFETKRDKLYITVSPFSSGDDW